MRDGIRRDTLRRMNTLLRTAEFDRWLKGVRDRVAQARIAQRLDAAVIGHFGDCEPVGEGVFEFRIDLGPGYRGYFFRAGRKMILLLCGGDKRTQAADIAKAKQFRRDYEQRTRGTLGSG